MMDLAPAYSPALALQRRSNARKIRRAIRWVVIAAVAIGLVVAGNWYLNRPIAVSAARAVQGPVAEVVYATGFVEPTRPVEVSSRVTAPVTAVLADEGDRIVAGQALARLDAEDQRHGIAQLVADRVNAEQNERRELALFRDGWVTRAARDQAVAIANSARAAEAAGRAKLDQYTIRSGISGIVLRRDVEPGDLASAAKTLFEIGDPRLLRVTATVDERDIPLVRTGSEVMMSTEAFPKKIFRGSVTEITPGGDPDQRAFRVRIRPDEGSALPIGLTLEVNIMVAERQHATQVPASAIHENSVWAVRSGRAERVPVQPGIAGTQRTEITSGLAVGACVVTDPPADLKDGQRVTVKGC